jgi:hypothetical protein
VRQGDPFSPLLFCIAEDVLSRNISKLVDEGHLQLINGTDNTRFLLIVFMQMTLWFIVMVDNLTL